MILFAEFPHVSKQLCFYFPIILLDLKLALLSGREFFKWKSCMESIVGQVLQQYAFTFQVAFSRRVFNAVDDLWSTFRHLYFFLFYITEGKQRKNFIVQNLPELASVKTSRLVPEIENV